MRITLLFALIILATTLTAQTYRAGSLVPNYYTGGFNNTRYPSDSSSSKKWFLTRYSALSTSYSVFKGGQATIVAAPVGFQLNRQLTNNVNAFGNATIAPAYITLNSSFMAAGANKAFQNSGPFKSSHLDVYSSASLGLMYVNDQKTFSIFGSIGVERNSYPLLPYYRPDQQRPALTGATSR